MNYDGRDGAESKHISFKISLMDQNMDFMKRWIRLFKYNHARIDIRGTKSLRNPHVWKLIWVFHEANYSFHSTAKHKDVSWNLQRYMDQFYKPRHRSVPWCGCHDIGDSCGVDTKCFGVPQLLNWAEAHLCSTEHISSEFQLKKLWKNNIFSIRIFSSSVTPFFLIGTPIEFPRKVRLNFTTI